MLSQAFQTWSLPQPSVRCAPDTAIILIATLVYFFYLRSKVCEFLNPGSQLYILSVCRKPSHSQTCLLGLSILQIPQEMIKH